MKINGSNKGFSLVELLVVMAIIAVLAGVGIPAMLGRMSHMRLKRDARSVMTELNAARLKAIINNTKYRVIFTLNASTPDTYSLSVFNSGAWGDDATRPTMELSAGIDIIAPGSSFNVYFFPNGVATNADNPAATSISDICLSNTSEANDRMELDLDNSSGKVTIGTGC